MTCRMRSCAHRSELCLQRRQSIAPDVVESVWRQFEDLGPSENHALDVVAGTPESIADPLVDGVAGRFRLSP